MDPNLFCFGMVIVAMFIGVAVGTWLPIVVECTVTPIINFITNLFKKI